MRSCLNWLAGATFVLALISAFVAGFSLCVDGNKNHIEAGYIENNGKLYHVTPATVVPLQEKMEKLCGDNACLVQQR